MKFHHLGLGLGALLLVAAQDAPRDAPAPPAESSGFAEAFAEQSNAARAGQAAEELRESDGPAEPAPTPSPSPESTEAPTPAGPAGRAVEAGSDAGPASALLKLAKGDPVTHDFLVGVWAEPGKSCEAGIDFQADGKMIGPFPRWELADGELTMVGNRQKMRLTVVDRNTMLSRRSETDPPRTLKRCPKAPPPPQP